MIKPGKKGFYYSSSWLSKKMYKSGYVVLASLHLDLYPPMAKGKALISIFTSVK